MGRNTAKGVGLLLVIALGAERVWFGTEEKKDTFELRGRREVAMIDFGIRHFINDGKLVCILQSIQHMRVVCSS